VDEPVDAPCDEDEDDEEDYDDDCDGVIFLDHGCGVCVCDIFFNYFWEMFWLVLLDLKRRYR